MKILFYAHSSTLYGANRSLIELILGLKKIDSKIQELIILPSNGVIEDELKKKSISYVIVPHFNWFYYKPFAIRWRKKSLFHFQIWYWKNRLYKQLKNNKFFSQHLKITKEFQPDLIYINSTLNPMGLKVAERLNIKNVWHHRETVNDNIYGYYLENVDIFKNYYQNATIHIYTSDFLKKNFENEFGKENSEVFYNSIIPDKQNEPRKVLNSKIRFGIVGRINNQKGQKEIIEVFNTPEIKSLNIELHIIGHGDKEFLEWFEKNNNNWNVFYHDFIARESIYDRFDFLISNARFEAFGRTIAEANYSGVPALVRNSGAFPELVKQDFNGFLFEEIENLKDALLGLSEISQERYATLSENCIAFAKENYNYIEIAKKVKGAIDEIIFKT